MKTCPDLFNLAHDAPGGLPDGCVGVKAFPYMAGAMHSGVSFAALFTSGLTEEAIMASAG